MKIHPVLKEKIIINISLFLLKKKENLNHKYLNDEKVFHVKKE
jgi:hypothetical protein